MTYSYRSTCAPRGSTVNIYCLYNTYRKDLGSRFWFSPDRSHQWLPGKTQDLRDDSQYAGRVQVFEERRSNGIRSNLQISDLRENDEGRYHFRFRTGFFQWWGFLPGTFLTVTGTDVHKLTQCTQTTLLQVKVIMVLVLHLHFFFL